MNQYLWINDCFYENTVNQRKTLKFFLKKNLFLQIIKGGVQIFGLSSDIPDFDWLPVVTWGLYQNTKALSFPSVNKLRTLLCDLSSLSFAEYVSTYDRIHSYFRYLPQAFTSPNWNCGKKSSCDVQFGILWQILFSF